MKKYIIGIVLCLTAIPGYSQVEQQLDDKSSQKLTKEQKAEQKRIEREAMAEMVDRMIKTRRFVLEADYLSNRTGSRVIVNSNLNFIIVDSSEITIQTAPIAGIGGPNGIGGVTAEGNIRDFRVEKVGRTKDSYSIRILAVTPVGQYDIFMDIFPDAGANASISGSTRGKLNYHGRLVPIKKSRHFKGQSI